MKFKLLKFCFNLKMLASFIGIFLNHRFYHFSSLCKSFPADMYFLYFTSHLGKRIVEIKGSIVVSECCTMYSTFWSFPLRDCFIKSGTSSVILRVKLGTTKTPSPLAVQHSHECKYRKQTTVVVCHQLHKIMYFYNKLRKRTQNKK